jgi:hypothetical protein
LYLQTTDSLPKVFALRLTDRYGVEHTSNKPSQDDKRVLTVTPEPVPYLDKDNYLLTVYRADGLWDGKPPNTGQWSITNPNYDWHAQSVDYWSLSYKFQNVIVPFVRVLWDKDGPGAQWASKDQQQEEAFAYIGYRLITGSEPIPSYLKFSSKLYDPILYNTEPPTLAPPNALLDDTLKGSTGSLLLSLHRVMNVFYSQKALIPGFDLEDAFEFTLWDANGNQHRLKVLFIEVRDKLQVLPQ